MSSAGCFGAVDATPHAAHPADSVGAMRTAEIETENR